MPLIHSPTKYEFATEQWISIDFIMTLYSDLQVGEYVQNQRLIMRNHSIAKRLISCVANIFKLPNHVLNVTHPMKQKIKKNDILKKKRLGTYFCCQFFVGDTSLGLPNASHLFNAAFYQPRDRTPTGLPLDRVRCSRRKRSPEFSNCLALKVSPAKAKTWEPNSSSKVLASLGQFFR